MPTDLIKRQNGVRARGDGLCDFGQVQAHRLGGAVGHDEAGACALDAEVPDFRIALTRYFDGVEDPRTREKLGLS